MKSGIKTSEFWVSIVCAALGALAVSTNFVTDMDQFTAVFGAPIAYIVSRGIAKVFPIR